MCNAKVFPLALLGIPPETVAISGSQEKLLQRREGCLTRQGRAVLSGLNTRILFWYPVMVPYTSMLL